MSQLSKLEKAGYAMGDAAANLVWRGALAYLAVFYTDTFGLAASATALLFLIVRFSDGITDIIMGMIADRTHSRWGKFRPWIFVSTPFLGLFMVLCFTTPTLSDEGKLVYAYVTYIGLILAYTVNNVPYSALMGVMTDDDSERTSLSGYRFAGAFLGGLLVMGFLPGMVAYFGDGDSAKGYQTSMYVFASLLVLMMMITVSSTKERVTTVNVQSNLKAELMDLCKQLPFIIIPLAALTAFFFYRNWLSGLVLVTVGSLTFWQVKRLVSTPRESMSSTHQDMIDLLTNRPWLILLGMGFLTMMFNGVKYGVIAYYFKYVVGDELLTGQYFIVLLLVSVVGALITQPLAARFGRKLLFIGSLLMSSALTCVFFWVPADNLSAVFIIGGAAELFAAIMPTLFFSMLGDAADYSEWKHGRRATGLVYSAGTFVQKTGGGFAGALVLLVLAQYGYDGMNKDTVEAALPGIILLMSFIPALFGLLAALLMSLYPISDAQQQQMTQDLIHRRSLAAQMPA